MRHLLERLCRLRIMTGGGLAGFAAEIAIIFRAAAARMRTSKSVTNAVTPDRPITHPIATAVSMALTAGVRNFDPISAVDAGAYMAWNSLGGRVSGSKGYS